MNRPVAHPRLPAGSNPKALGIPKPSGHAGPPKRPQSPQSPQSQPHAKADPSLLPPHANPIGSALALAGLGLTALFLHGDTPVQIATFAAWGVLASLAITIGMDLRLGIRNVVRTDLMALMALYFLTLTEFLVNQLQFNSVAGLVSTRTAVTACILAYAGLIVGRHLVSPTRKNPFQSLFLQPVPSAVLFSIFWACVILGYANMLLSVKGNVLVMLDYFCEPRFVQPWQRGRLGDWKAMLYELNMMLYLIPPLGGVLIARRRKYPFAQIFFVALGVAFTLFYGFSSGTRNIFASYLVTFLIGYVFAADRRRQGREIAIITILSAVAMVASTKLMLDFRDVGLKDYILKGYYATSASNTQEGQSLAVDNNLYAISRVAEYFPRHHDYTGFEIPYLALIHPIPRVLWPGKPEGMSFSVEDIFAAKDYTVATSVVGEEYMMHGYITCFLMSVFFGACCAWWNLLASPKNSEFGILVYASGFFSAVITMRSMGWFSTALLPTAAGLLLGFIFLRQNRSAAMHPTRSPRPPGPARPRIAPTPR
jgi:hypothetical protein